MAAAALALAGPIFNAIFGGNKDRQVGELVGNVQNGAANDVITSTGAGQGLAGSALANANGTLQGVYGDQKAALQPYQDAGVTGVNGLKDLASGAKFSYTPDDFKNDPGGYQFLLNQGKEAISNTAAARGLGSSGNTLKDLTTFGQGLAETKYGESFNRAQSAYQTNQTNTLNTLQALTNAGLTATGQFNAASQNFGNNTANNDIDVAKFMANLGLQGTEFATNDNIDAAKSRASGILGQTNAITGGVNQVVQGLTGDSGNGSSGLTNILKALGVTG